MSTLVVVGYDEPFKAEEVRIQLQKLHREYLLDLEDAVVAFMNLVPFDAAKNCYKLAAQSLHPDKHLDDANAGAKMAKLNELWSRIEKEFYKR